MNAPRKRAVQRTRKATHDATAEVPAASAAGGERTRVLGTLYAPRRKPTAQEIQEINRSLAAMETKDDAGVADAPAHKTSPDTGAGALQE